MLYCIQEIVPEWEVRDREEGLVLALYEKIGIAADIRTNKLEPICTF